MNLLAATEPMRRMKVLGYALAIALSFIALWIRFQLDSSLSGYPFLTFFVAVFLSALLGGLGPGLLAALLSGLLALYFLDGSGPGFSLAWPSGWIAMAFYYFSTLTMVGLVHGMVAAYQGQERLRLALEDLNTTLEAKVLERAAMVEREAAERIAAEDKVRHLQKMESIGQLSGGIAHDFNNMLGVVIGSLDVAKMKLSGKEHPKVEACIDHAIDGAQRAAVLTARLLAYSRQLPLAPQAIDANKLVSGMSEMLRRTIGEQVRIETVLAGGLWPCFADPAQLEDAVLNLAVNARDAMPDGGKLTVETANVDLDDRYAISNDEVTPGQYVMIAVSDSGTGMPPEVVGRASEPFYTTKDVGKGTGLGLSQVFGYVRQSGGHLKIYSEIGQGTTVKIYLPRHLGQAAPEKGVVAASHIPHGRPEQLILVVEDEAQVRQMTVAALKELGYSVIQAANGDQALELIQGQSHIDLLFTDIVMPGMTGRVLADHARTVRPEMRVLFTTGYTRNAVVHNGVLDTGIAFLTKPFTVEQLALKIRDVLRDQGFNR